MPITKLNLPQKGTPEYDEIIRRFESAELEYGTTPEEMSERETREAAKSRERNEKHLAKFTKRIADAAKCQTDGIDQPVTMNRDDAQKIDLDTATTAEKQANVEAILHNLQEDTPSVKYIHEAWHGGLHLRISVEPHGPDEISFRFFGDDDSVPDQLTVFSLKQACQFARGLILAIVASADREVGFTMEDFTPGSWEDAVPAWFDDEKRERVHRFLHALERAPNSLEPTNADTELDDDRQFLIDYVRQQENAAQRLMEIAERLSSG